MGDFIGGVFFYCCGWIIIGGVAGGLARNIMGARNRPFINDVILGVIGAWVGGFVVSLIGWDDSLDIGFGIGTLVTALIGAVLLIAAGRVLRGRR